MEKISKNTLDFLKDLRKNNYRDWFQQNKKRHDAAREEFIQFTDALIQRIGKFDPAVKHHQAKDCVFRIYRDVRFSSDKSPYKTHFGGHITPATKKSDIHTRAGYYLQLEPGNTMLAGGAYLPQGTWLNNIRKEIDKKHASLEKILKSASFKKYFGQMIGEQLKTTPKGYDKEHPAIELLRHKSFLATHRCSDKIILSSDFLDHCTHVFKALQPFDAFLNQAKA